MTASILLKFKINICEVSDQPAYWKMRDQRDWVIRGEDWLFNVLIILRQLTMILTVLAMLPTVSTLHSTGLHRRTLSMNCVKWRTSRLVSDSVLPRLHHWSSAILDYPPSGTEPLRLPLLASGTVYHSTSLAPSLLVFRSRLKTHLFTISYPIVHALWHFHFGHFNPGAGKLFGVEGRMSPQGTCCWPDR